MKHGKVCFPDVPVALELPSQCEIRPLRTGEHHHAARIAVKTVHNPRALDTADTRHVREILQQDVAQRSVGIPRRTMHNHARRLVDHDYVVIRMDDLHRYVTFLLHLLL